MPAKIKCLWLALLGQSFAVQAASINHAKLSATTEIIAIDGEIVAGDVEAFRQVSLRYPRAVVVLNSQGGLIQTAIEIGKVIRIAGYSTAVGENHTCASACALIWMAGSKRILFPTGRVGFHASYYDTNGTPVESGVGNALVGNYLTLLGASAKTIVFATTAPPTSILWLTPANREASGIDFDLITAPSAHNPVPDSDLPDNLRPATRVQTSPPPVIIPPPPEPDRSPPRFDEMDDETQRADKRAGQTRLSRPLQPLTTPAEWVTWRDFPDQALGVHGDVAPDVSLSVAFILDVDKWGQVSRCRVTASSGLQALDEATCRATIRRARFIPATDRNGRPTAATYSKTVRWSSGKTAEAESKADKPMQWNMP